MADKGIPLSGRKKESPRPEVNDNNNNNNNNNNGIKQTSRAGGPMLSSRDKEIIGSARDKEIIGSARDKEIIGSARDKVQQPQISARDEPIVTNRSVMDTARVHTALAALAAERNVLISKLNYIDSALESEKKKRNSRSIRK